MIARRCDADVIVVGSGPAGASIAGLLALRAHRVLLLHAGPPVGGGTLTLFPGLRTVVNELGLLARLDGASTRRCSGVEVTDPGGRTWTTPFAEHGPYPHGYHVDRAVLHRLLLLRAVELGVRVEHSPVRDLVRARHRVVGVRHGPRHQETTARLVIDAAGAGRSVTGPAATAGPSRSVLRMPLRGVPDAGSAAPLRVRVCDPGRSWAWATPLDGDGVEVACSVPDDGRAPDPRSLLPDDGVLRLAGPVVRTGYRRRVPTVVHGPGWAAIGDALLAADPPLAGGATLAVITAAPLAEAADLVLRGRAAERPTMARYATGVRDLLTDVDAYARAAGVVAGVGPEHPSAVGGQPGAGLSVLLCGTVGLRPGLPSPS